MLAIGRTQIQSWTIQSVKQKENTTVSKGSRECFRRKYWAGTVVQHAAPLSLCSTGIPYECQVMSQLLWFRFSSLLKTWRSRRGWPKSTGAHKSYWFLASDWFSSKLMRSVGESVGFQHMKPSLSVFPCFSVKSVLQTKRICKSNIIIPQLGTGFRPSCSTSNSSLLPGKIAEDGPDTWVPANTWEPQPGFPGPGPHTAVMAIGK